MNLHSKRVIILIEAVLPTLPMMYSPISKAPYLKMHQIDVFYITHTQIHFLGDTSFTIVPSLQKVRPIEKSIVGLSFRSSDQPQKNDVDPGDKDAIRLQKLCKLHLASPGEMNQFRLFPIWANISPTSATVSHVCLSSLTCYDCIMWLPPWVHMLQMVIKFSWRDQRYLGTLTIKVNHCIYIYKGIIQQNYI